MRILGINNTINFQRRPTKEEEPDLKSAVDKAYDIMGTEERAVITHGSCFPALNRDTYIGSPYGKAAKEYIKFLNLYGFNGMQLGPGGELQKGNVSSYNSSAFAKNRLFIDLEELTTDKYDHILSKETFNKVTRPPIFGEDYNMTDFAEAEHTYNIALKESYKNFRKNLFNGKPEALALNIEYSDFKRKHGERLNDEAVFKLLSNIYGTDDFSKWNNPLDENLISEFKTGDPKAFERYKQLNIDHQFEIEQYKFEQFIATKQIKENKEWRDELGFKYINDLLVGCSKMDEWRYKDAFLQDWEMGARENNSPSQRWHIPVIDPKKIMIGDELNIGGKFLKEKIDFALEFCDNIRIDHVMGLIEPYLMSKHAPDNQFNTGAHKNKDVEMFISELKNPENPNEEYDFYWDYPQLLERIILPALQEHGITKEMAMWEDICSYPDRFKAIYSKLELPKISFLDWEKAEDAVKTNPDNWFILGNHDNIPVMNYLQRKDGEGYEYTKNMTAWNPLYLAGYLHQNEKRADERNAYCDKIANDDRELVFAKFAELMTTPKFQISFDDLLGITDAIYNIPGSARENNWKERIPSDFLDRYYENLSSDNPTALNIPELLKTALQAKIDMSENSEELYKKYQPVIDKLEHYAEVLKE